MRRSRLSTICLVAEVEWATTHRRTGRRRPSGHVRCARSSTTAPASLVWRAARPSRSQWARGAAAQVQGEVQAEVVGEGRGGKGIIGARVFTRLGPQCSNGFTMLRLGYLASRRRRAAQRFPASLTAQYAPYVGAFATCRGSSEIKAVCYGAVLRAP